MWTVSWASPSSRIFQRLSDVTDAPTLAPGLPQATGYEALVTLSAPRSSLAEAFRQLRTAIQYRGLDRPVRTLLATSTGPDEGKTAALANLAITLAQSGHSVVLVDADLRQPSLHLLFGLENASGLATLLTEEAAQPLPLQESGVPQLRLLPSGPPPPNPAELLGSARMGEVLQLLRAQGDYVLFDAPPIVPVTDAAVLAPQMDGVLLILKAGKTKRELAQRAKSLLQKVNANILGVVLNNVKQDAGIRSYYTRQEGPPS